MAPRTPRPRPAAARKPKGKDTDKDGLTDAEERRFGSDPRKKDTDGDSVGDHMEYLISSNPRDKDTDHDGLNDWEELEAYDTAVTLADTDLDGLDDGQEVIFWRSNPKLVDSDHDGLRDDVELQLGTALSRNDTDDDGIVDGLEVGLGIDPRARHGEVQATALNAAHRLPTITGINLDGTDDDRDGYANWIERTRGTDPADDRQVPMSGGSGVPTYRSPTAPGPDGGRTSIDPTLVDPVTGEPLTDDGAVAAAGSTGDGHGAPPASTSGLADPADPADPTADPLAPTDGDGYAPVDPATSGPAYAHVEPPAPADAGPVDTSAYGDAYDEPPADEGGYDDTYEEATYA